MDNWIKVTSIFLLSGLFLFGIYYSTAESDSKGPMQPILFSHKIHAGENQMPCEYCHSFAEVSTNPGIPSVQKCIGCHSQVHGKDEEYTTNDGQVINFKTEINKVKDYWERKEPIPWVKVTNMPDYVRFNHKRHIKRGFECQTCHGEVQEMDVVYKAERLNMGFCLSCHEEHADNPEHLTQLKDCLTCHY